MKEDSEPYEVNPDKEWVIENIKNRIEILSSVQCFFHNELETPLILVLEELKKLSETGSNLLYYVDATIITDDLIKKAAKVSGYNFCNENLEKIIKSLMEHWVCSKYSELPKEIG